MTNLTTEEFWTKLGRKIPKPGDKTSDMEFREILEEHLSKTDGIALEVGCVPGTFLAYLYNKFGYLPEGIDFDKKTKEITSKTLENFGVMGFTIYQKDFNKWRPKKRYDLECSFGFIEHFDNAKEIVQKHIDLVKEGGKVIIEIPNFAGFNGFLHRLVDRPNLEKHNTSIMNLEFFKKIAEENNLKIKYLGYYGSWHFQWGYGRLKTANILQIAIYAILKMISKITVHIKMRNKLSNYILFIAEK